MQFFALLLRNTQKFADADFAPLLPDEAQRRRALYVEGTARQVWNRTDLPGAALMLEADDLAAARTAIDSLPLVGAGMMRVESLVPLVPYPGFGPRT